MDERPWHRSYDPGVPRELDLESLTVPQFLERSLRQSGDRTALVFMNRRMTYRQLKEAVDRLATAMAGLGVQKDTRVAIHLRLAAYKVPKMIEFRNELPKSAVLKILRRELREEELAKMRSAGE